MEKYDVDDQVYSVPLEDIIIRKGRYRENMGDIEALAESIKMHGQLTPIWITQNMVLIAGERRYRACTLLKQPTIKCIVKRPNEIQMKVFEIIENLHRKDFDWKEAVVATEDLHNIMVATHGPSWSGNKTADAAKLARGGVSMDLQLARALKEAPDIFEKCKTKEQAYKALKKFEIDEAEAELALRKTKTKYGQRAKNLVYNGDCTKLIDQIPDKHFNVLLSDPSYGIDVFNVMFHNTKDVPQESKKAFDDTEERFKNDLSTFITKVNRVMKDDSFVLLFCAYSNSQWLIDRLTEIGYNMDAIPGVWAKKVSGRTNCPDHLFNRQYELFVYGSRGKYSLVKQGTGNVIITDNLLSSEREHPHQKPVELMDEIISRICLPGYTILDFMCGSGSTLTSAIKKGCIPIGFELDEHWYNVAVKNVAKALELKDAGMANNI